MLLVLTETEKPSNRLKSYKPKSNFPEKKTDRRKNQDRKIATNKEPTTLINDDNLQISTLNSYIIQKITDSLMLLVLTETEKPSNRLKSYKPKNNFPEKNMTDEKITTEKL